MDWWANESLWRQLLSIPYAWVIFTFVRNKQNTKLHTFGLDAVTVWKESLKREAWFSTNENIQKYYCYFILVNNELKTLFINAIDQDKCADSFDNISIFFFSWNFDWTAHMEQAEKPSSDWTKRS